MRVIQHGRRGGKTTELVAAWRQHGHGDFVVFSQQERHRIVNQYALTSEEARRVIVAGEHVLRGRQGDVFVDNADWILRAFLGRDVDVATVNGEPDTGGGGISGASDRSHG